MSFNSFNRYSVSLSVFLACLSIVAQLVQPGMGDGIDWGRNQTCTLWSRTGVPIQGVRNVTVLGRSEEFCSFYRIPYARPPVKKLRFKKAQLVRLFNAKSKPLAFKALPPECTQESREQGLIGQEDCLFINVFTKRGVQPMKTPPVLQPVVVWIHGGTFTMGSGLSDGFNPNAFIEEDIVVVSFNYRLDLFGFFPVSPDEPYSLNLGLDDQKVALRWVKKHIKIFGGDPGRVTIMGWSAGSASVNYLLYDKEANGLFHSAIAMSGSFLSPWANINDPLKIRQTICDTYKAKECTLNGLLATLGRNFKDLALFENIYYKGITTVVWGTLFPVFSPMPEYPGDSPELRLRVGPLNDVPLLMGVTNEETRNFQLGTQIDWRPQSTFVFPNDDPKNLRQIVEMLQVIKARSPLEFKDHLAMADLYYGVYKFVQLHQMRTKKSLYFYRFNYNPEDGSTNGAAHGYDIKLLFRGYDADIPGNIKVASAMEKLWTNFIKHKHPTPADSPSHWPAISDEKHHVLQIKSHTMETEPLELSRSSPLFSLWDDIYNCLNNYICDKPIWNGTGCLEEAIPTTTVATRNITAE